MADLEARLTAVENTLGDIGSLLAHRFPIVGPLPVQNPPIPLPIRYPGDVLDLRNWKLTLPILGSDGKIEEIFQPELATYSSVYFSLTDPLDGVRFRVWHGGETTQKSKNPRSELREMMGEDLAAWDPHNGTHSMRITGTVNRLTKVKPHTVLGQFHDEDNDIATFRVEGSNLYVTDGNNTHAFLVDDNFRLGVPYSLTMNVSGATLWFRYNDKTVLYSKPVTGTSTKWYFRAGAYLQSNPTTAPTEVTSEYTEVVIRSLSVSHS